MSSRKQSCLKRYFQPRRRFDWYPRRIKVRNSFPRILFSSSSSLFCPGVVWLLLASSFSVLSSSFLFFLLRQTRLSPPLHLFSLSVRTPDLCLETPSRRSTLSPNCIYLCSPRKTPRSHSFRSTPRLSSPIRCNRVSLLSRRENFQSSSRTNIWRRSRRTRSRRNVSQTRIFPSRIIPLALPSPSSFLSRRRHQSRRQSRRPFSFLLFSSLFCNRFVARRAFVFSTFRRIEYWPPRRHWCWF